jgi:hypothetical protein
LGQPPVVCALLVALLGLTGVAGANPHSPAVQVSGGDSLSLWVLVDWEQPLPTFVQERLERGIPATVGLRVELWKARAGWFNQHLTTEGTEMKILRDPWGGSFTIVGDTASAGVDSMAALQRSLSRHKIRVPLARDWCDGDSRYQVVVTTIVRPLTASDVGEVETWLRGEIKGFGNGALGLPRGLFGIVRDLSGLGEQTSTASSPRFRLARLADDRVRVLIPGAAAADR